MAERMARIAIFDGDKGVVELYRELFDDWRDCPVLYAAFGHDGAAPAAEYLREHDPSVVVWDVSPPYEDGCSELLALIDAGAFRGRELVVTSTDDVYARRRIGSRAIVVGKPFDVDDFLTLVGKLVAGERPTNREVAPQQSL